MTIRVYAVVCANGEIHPERGWLAVFQTQPEASVRKQHYDIPLPVGDRCQPHRLITLRGEVSLSRRPA